MFIRVKSRQLLMVFVAAMLTAPCVANEKEQQAITDQKTKLDTLMVVKDTAQFIEDIAYPEKTRFKLYLSHSAGKYFSIEKITVVLDGLDKAGFEYNELQQKALLRGGSNRIYMATVSEGIHELVVVFDGKDRDRNIIKKAQTLLFDKKPGEMIVVVRVKDNEKTIRPDFEFTVIKGK